MGKVYVGDVGTEIRLYCMTDLATAVNPLILVKKPDGTETTWAATATADDALSYTTQAGDLALPGEYKLQAKPNLASWDGRGETVVLRVYRTFEL